VLILIKALGRFENHHYRKYYSLLNGNCGFLFLEDKVDDFTSPQKFKEWKLIITERK
jgi:hypothetical protein